MRPGFALDHLTVADASPVELLRTARDVECRSVCPFLHAMDVLPRMPAFDLVADLNARRDFATALADFDLGVDLAYPFTLAGRTIIDSLGPLLDCAAEIGAVAVNVLAYDREPARRVEGFGRFCDAARDRGLLVAVEFFPLSQVATLDDALALVGAIGRRGEVGVNVDLLHLVRSGGSLADVAAAPEGTILYAQLCDGPATIDPGRLNFEASSQRLLAGDGVFDCAGFLAALPADCPVSIELPQDDALAAHVSMLERAQRAVESVGTVLAIP